MANENVQTIPDPMSTDSSPTTEVTSPSSDTTTTGTTDATESSTTTADTTTMETPKEETSPSTDTTKVETSTDTSSSTTTDTSETAKSEEDKKESSDSSTSTPSDSSTETTKDETKTDETTKPETSTTDDSTSTPTEETPKKETKPDDTAKDSSTEEKPTEETSPSTDTKKDDEVTTDTSSTDAKDETASETTLTDTIGEKSESDSTEIPKESTDSDSSEAPKDDTKTETPVDDPETTGSETKDSGTTDVTGGTSTPTEETPKESTSDSSTEPTETDTSSKESDSSSDVPKEDSESGTGATDGDSSSGSSEGTSEGTETDDSSKESGGTEPSTPSDPDSGSDSKEPSSDSGSSGEPVTPTDDPTKSDDDSKSTDEEPDITIDEAEPFSTGWSRTKESFDAMKKYVEKSISNGTINPRILNQFFEDMKLKSYDYDYIMQRELVGLQRESFSMKHVRCYMLKGVYSETYDRVYEFTLGHRIVNPKERERFKRSPIFNKYIDLETISANRKFFSYHILVMSGPKILTNWRLKALNGSINICFLKKTFDPELTNFNVYFIPNCVCSVCKDLTDETFVNNEISTDMFPSNESFYKYENYIGYWIDKTDNTGYMMIGIGYDSSKKVFTIGGMLPTDVSKYSLMVLGILNMHEISDYDSSTEWIQYHDHKMPIPKDNFMIFVNKDHIYQPNDGSIELTEYYPNLYKVSNPNGYAFRLIQLYADYSENEHIEYDNEVKNYLNVMRNLPDYSPDMLPDSIKEYKPIKWTYNVDKFIEDNPWHELDLSNKWTPLLYNVYILSKTLKHWYLMYDQYMRRTFTFLSGWYHRIADYDNMEEKERLTSAEDVENKEDYTYHFQEPQYVFTYVHNSMLGDANAYCFFIDGKFTLPTRIIIYRGYQYVYFPKRLINSDTIIEVERFDNDLFSYLVDIPTEGKTIELRKIMKYDTVANNLFLVAPDGRFLNHDEVDTYIIDPELGEIKVDLETSVFAVSHLGKLKLVPTDKYTDTKVYVCCNDSTFQYKASENGDDFYEKDPNTVTLNPKNGIVKAEQDFGHRLRIYTEDGRLIPKRSYTIYKYKDYFSGPHFNIPIQPGENRTFLISYIGYDERLIYHKESIPENGLVKLEGKLSRPVDLAYQDIYLGGYRLTAYDIDIITPFSFIVKKEALEKYNTLDTLEIYEKTYVPDYFAKFTWEDKSKFIMDELFNKDDKFYEEIVGAIEPASVTGSSDPVDFVKDWFFEFLANYLPYHFTDGDSRKDLERYHHIFNEHGRVCLDADNRAKYADKIRWLYYFDHDLTIDKYGTDPTKYPTAPEIQMDNSEEIPMDDSISIPEDHYLRGGYRTVLSRDKVYDVDIETESEEDTLVPSIDPYDSIPKKNYYDPDLGTNHGFKRDNESEQDRYEMPEIYAGAKQNSGFKDSEEE